ncbi:MAG: hypothetical protein SNJ29_11610 [Rikenellaceae bacterium]
MCTEEFIWYQSPEIWAAVIAAVSAIITMVFSGVFFYRKHKILANFQTDIDEKKEDLVRTTNEMQERLRVEYGTVYTRRLEVIEELHKRLIYLRSVHNTYNKLFNGNKREYSNSVIAEIKAYGTFEKEFNQYFDENKIFLPKDLAIVIDTYYNAKIATFNANIPWPIAESIHRELGKNDAELEIIKQEGLEIKRQADDNIKNGHTLDGFLDEIEDEFRYMIGANADIERSDNK